MAEDKLVKIKALSPIWTGDANGQGDRLITTGLLGSIRWWFEVLVRGLGGSACDPSDGDNRCPDKQIRHCVVCELFGCTGWARKFRFQVVDGSGNAIKEAIKMHQEFTLRFTQLRPIRDEEWGLLGLTIRLITDYGAIGGRTVLKPSDETSRANALHHRDYGLVKIESPNWHKPLERKQLEDYVGNVQQWRRVNHGDFAWASLKNFWSVNGRYLARQNANHSTFNKVLGRKEDKSVKEKKGKRVVRWSDPPLASQDPVSQWFAGRQQESKKVFSFKEPPRTFGFVKPGTVDFNEMKRRLRNVWPNFNDQEFLERSHILDRLFNTPGSTP